jgi:hypothetical protein
MAEWLAPLPASQVARVQSLVPARPTNIMEKVALFCNLRGHVLKVAKAKVFPHLEARVSVGRGISAFKGQLKLVNGLLFQNAFKKRDFVAAAEKYSIFDQRRIRWLNAIIRIVSHPEGGRKCRLPLDLPGI